MTLVVFGLKYLLKLVFKMDKFANLGIILFIISNTPWLSYGQDVCVKKGPCTCAFPNGTGIDLTPTAKSTFFTAQIFSEKKAGAQLELSTFYYHPCYDVVPPVNNTSPTDTCGVPLALCLNMYTLEKNATANVYTMDKGVNSYMGKANDSVFSAMGDSIIYKNLPSETIVLLVCAEADDKLHIQSLEEPNKVVLAFYSQSACLKKIEEPDTGRSLGSTLLIVFFSCVIFYLVLGVGTKKFLMGATGIEVIPNLGFWSDLPNLVKDGWAFTLNGFKLPVRSSGPVLSPDPNSYDSI